MGTPGSVKTRELNRETKMRTVKRRRGGDVCVCFSDKTYIVYPARNIVLFCLLPREDKWVDGGIEIQWEVCVKFENYRTGCLRCPVLLGRPVENGVQVTTVTSVYLSTTRA